MDVTKISLSKEDLTAIVEAMGKFPTATDATLICEMNDDKCTLALGVMTTLNDMTGHFIVPIAMNKTY